jgi:hypothetical protein
MYFPWDSLLSKHHFGKGAKALVINYWVHIFSLDKFCAHDKLWVLANRTWSKKVWWPPAAEKIPISPINPCHLQWVLPDVRMPHILRWPDPKFHQLSSGVLSWSIICVPVAVCGVFLLLSFHVWCYVTVRLCWGHATVFYFAFRARTWTVNYDITVTWSSCCSKPFSERVERGEWIPAATTPSVLTEPSTRPKNGIN